MKLYDSVLIFPFSDWRWSEESALAGAPVGVKIAEKAQDYSAAFPKIVIQNT